MTRKRIAVLASGAGSNLEALIDYFRALGDARAGDIVLVASDRPDAGALTRGRAAGIPAATITSRHAHMGEDLSTLLDRHSIDIVVLAGYLQLIPAELARRFDGRMLNVHPAPLPAFGGRGMYGVHVHRAVLASGAELSGPTVHFVDEQYDHGATVAHSPVPVFRDDDERSLAARVLAAEHRLYPRVVQALAAGEITLGEDGTVTCSSEVHYIPECPAPSSPFPTRPA